MDDIIFEEIKGKNNSEKFPFQQVHLQSDFLVGKINKDTKKRNAESRTGLKGQSHQIFIKLGGKFSPELTHPGIGKEKK